MTKRQRAIADEEAPIFGGGIGTVGYAVSCKSSFSSESIERAEKRIEELKLLIKAWKDDRKSEK